MTSPIRTLSLFCAAFALVGIGCSRKTETAPATKSPQPAVTYFKVDPATAASITGTIRYKGKVLPHKPIDMSEDPACVAAHHGKASDESLQVGRGGALEDAFVYIKSGMEGKNFETPSEAVVIDQNGCWFQPHVLGVQTNQLVKIVNSDPVTHNIHPMAEVNRAWNHSQGPGDPPLERKFTKPEIMIPVKCNIHGWMHAYIGVLDHPYFSVSKNDGTFTIGNLPPGTYTLAVWQEKLGTQEQTITITPQQHAVVDFTYKGK
jgi:plastocyanin